MKTISGCQDNLVWIQCNSTLWPILQNASSWDALKTFGGRLLNWLCSISNFSSLYNEMNDVDFNCLIDDWLKSRSRNSLSSWKGAPLMTLNLLYLKCNICWPWNSVCKKFDNLLLVRSMDVMFTGSIRKAIRPLQQQLKRTVLTILHGRLPFGIIKFFCVCWTCWNNDYKYEKIYPKRMTRHCDIG